MYIYIYLNIYINIYIYILLDIFYRLDYTFLLNRRIERRTYYDSVHLIDIMIIGRNHDLFSLSLSLSFSLLFFQLFLDAVCIYLLYCVYVVIYIIRWRLCLRKILCLYIPLWWIMSFARSRFFRFYLDLCHVEIAVIYRLIYNPSFS